jgi:putative ABC transport system permease protein
VAILTLALGIGANTMIFSVIDTVLLQPLPYTQPDRLVMVWETTEHSPGERDSVSLPNYLDWKLDSRAFEGMALFDAIGKGYNLSGSGPDDGDPEQVSGVRVSATFFPLLGIEPYLGRTFRPEEETPGKDREVVLSYGLWKRRYKGDPALVGRTVQVDGDDYTVVGVMPPEFQFQHRGGLRELWVPIGYTDGDQRRDSRSFNVFARLKPGVTLRQTRDEMESLGQQLSRRYPQDNAGRGATVTPMSRLGAGERWQTLRTLLAAVGFVLLIACVNVANLMLARSAVRQKELGVRRALGAGPARIARQLLTESLLLSLVGGAAGFVLVMWSTGFLIRILPYHIRTPPFQHFDALRIDGRVFGFTLLVSCLTGVLAGLAPAFSGSGRDLNRSLKAGGSLGTSPAGPDGGARLRHVLVASEVALALLVLAGAGLMIDSMARLLGVKPGLDPKNVLTMEMSLPQFNIYYGPPFHPLFCHDLDESIGALPGVVSVGSVSHLPLRGVPADRGFTIEGRPDPGAVNLAIANYAVACPNYFSTMRIPVLQGREFTDKDRLAAPPVAIINASMARRFWPDQNAVGGRFKPGGFNSTEPWLTVVGVIQDVRQGGLDGGFLPQFFRPYAQAAWPVMTVVVRTTSDPMSFAVLTKKALADIDPDQPVSNIRTMNEVVDDSLGPRRFPMLLLIAFSLLALVLAAVGIVGVVSYSVAQRTHEIGIRMALGARKTDVLKLVVSRTMLWVAVGVGLGLIGSISLRRLLAGLLYGVSPADPLVLGTVSVLLASVALLASYIPARRAAKVDPLVALRWE